MKAQMAGLSLGVLLLAGCASTDVSNKDTLNERSDRFATREDRLPPNPNRPVDNREQKATPTIVQKDPALDKAPLDREDKGLAVNAGPDQHVRPQDPTQNEQAPKAVGGAATTQPETVNSADVTLATRVKEALSTAPKTDANIDPTLTAKESKGENKAIQNLEIAAKNGVVTLSGSVKSDAERTSAEQAASRVKGVTSVNNYLTVSKTDKQ
ncbi:MAG TPA: BON domain-containing protein [Verrucomicrobiae bacterium]|nr:BON domain-containing protein [Verrucomicrobiae bacterium]